MEICKRQHFIAQFYQRNFAAPMFSDDVWVFTAKEKRWERRTPKGQGWAKHLYSLFENDGNRTDEFDKYLKTDVEDPAVGPLKKAAVQPESLNETERQAVARFMAFTALRTEALIDRAASRRIGEPELESEAREWAEKARLNFDKEKALREYLQPNILAATIEAAQKVYRKIALGEWDYIHTSRDRPFITSDWPVCGERGIGIHLATFPISSEVAVVTAIT